MRLSKVALPVSGIVLLASTLVPSTVASASSTLLRSAIASTLAANAPVVRLSSSTAIDATRLPKLVTAPPIKTAWVQVGPNAAQAMVVGVLPAATAYSVKVPTQLDCSGTCTVQSSHTVTLYSVTEMTYEAQLLAELHYLPVTFTPANPSANPTQPTLGTFTWRFPNLPQSIKSQWDAGSRNAILRGAVMAFEDVHHMKTNGVVDDPVLQALQRDVAAGAAGLSPRPWNYVDVSKSGYGNFHVEMLSLYIDGVIATPPNCSTCWDEGNYIKVNTGISVAPTASGTFPVWYRYRVQTMRGINPDGSHYVDAGIQWVSYFNGGDALHQFYRRTYGTPQSLGCVEMSALDAKFVWPNTPIGTLVGVHA
jgi:L,D-transpeptidase catalytic domain